MASRHHLDERAAAEARAAKLEEAAVYGEFHRYVFQGIMAAGYVDLEKVKVLFAKVCEALKVDRADREVKQSMEWVRKVMLTLNNELNPFNMAIKSATCEMSRRKYFVFLVTAEKSILKQQMTFSKLELELFQAWLNGIMRKYTHFSMPIADCINAISKIDPRAPKHVAEELVHKLLHQMYLTKYPIDNTEFDVTLGIRTMKEFELILADVYPDVIEHCKMCNGILLHGFRCPECKILFHSYCFDKYMALKQVTRKCFSPNCEFEWERDNSKNSKKSDNMLRRFRDTDEMIQDQGPDVDLSNYKWMRHRKEESSIWKAMEKGDTPVPMPFLEPQAGPSSSSKSSPSKKSDRKGRK